MVVTGRAYKASLLSSSIALQMDQIMHDHLLQALV
jgi:hypothetical protein